MNEPAGPKLTFAGKLIVALFVAGCLYGAYALFLRKPLGGSGAASGAQPAPQKEGGGLFGGDGPAVRVGIAYGTEKERWLQWAAAEFTKTSDGKRIRIELIPMGSLEGAQAVLAGDQRINVWSPASLLSREIIGRRHRFQRHRVQVSLRGQRLHVDDETGSANRNSCRGLGLGGTAIRSGHEEPPFHRRIDSSSARRDGRSLGISLWRRSAFRGIFDLTNLS